MATPSPQPTPRLVHIKAAAAPRKLPIKRKTAPKPIHPSAKPGSTPAPAPAASFDGAAIVDDGPGALAGPEEDDFDDDEDEMAGGGAEPGEEGEAGGGGAGASRGGDPPFKFQRIWSEPDEIRFLQGLLACHSQGMAFPRDLNLFYDRFSEAMSQPYTRSQLSEKLRRLRKKFRAHSARVACLGLDRSALSPHDRDLFHFSTLLWDPAFAASSPFGSSGSTPGNKRRRRMPAAGAGAPDASVRGSRSGALCTPPHSTPSAVPPASAAAASPSAPPDGNRDGGLGGIDGCQEEKTPFQQRKLLVGSGGEGLGHLSAKSALDVFDSCLEEVRATLVRRALLHCDQAPISAPERDLSRRWREQRVTELDVLARRLRLVLEQTVED